MAQDGRAVIAAILASLLLGIARLASADSACLHCVGNAEVSPFHHYFRSAEGEHQPTVKDRADTLEKDQTGDAADRVKSCTNMCMALAQDGPTGKLLEKYLPESVSKLSTWLKSFVKDSFTVDNKTNSIRRKRDARYDRGIPEVYDFVELSVDDYVEEELIAGEDFPDWDDSVAQMKALPKRVNRRHYLREHGKPDKPRPRSDCLARQQETLMEVMNVLDQIAEKAIEELQRMMQEEFEREMLELEPFKLPMWWIIGLQQNNLILPYLYKEEIQPELPRETHGAEDIQPSLIPGETRSSTTRDPPGSTSRASAVAIATGDSMLASWYPYQQPNDQSWYPYQNTIPAQTWYPYPESPSNQQSQYSPYYNVWYASSPDGTAQVPMSGNSGQTVYVAEDGNKIVMVTSSGTTPRPPMAAYATKPDETTAKVPKPKGFPETTPVPLANGLPEKQPTLTGVTVQQTGLPQTTPVPETTALPQTTPKVTGAMSDTANPAAGNAGLPQTTPKTFGGMSDMAKPTAGNTAAAADAENATETGLQQTTPKITATNPQETTPVPETTGSPQTTPKITGGNAQETTSVPETTASPTTTPKADEANTQGTGQHPTTPKVPAANSKETAPVPETTEFSQPTQKLFGGMFNKNPTPGTTTTIPMTTSGNPQDTTTTTLPPTTPKAAAANTRETTSVPETTTTVEETTPMVPDATPPTQTDNTTPNVTSHATTSHAYPTITTAKQDDETHPPTTDPDATEVTTQPAEETDSDVSTRALLRFNDEVIHPDCDGTTPAKRFLPAILKVLKLKAK